MKTSVHVVSIHVSRPVLIPNTSYLLNLQPLEDDQRTDAAWLKSALKEITSKLKDADKKMLALKNSIDVARVSNGCTC